MAKIIAISGAASTGKSSIFDALYSSSEMMGWKFTTDIFDTVWQDMVDRGIFHEFEEVCLDNDYLCTYIVKVLEYYNKYIEEHAATDELIVMEGSWVDIAIYTIVNMWYNSVIKPVQDELLSQVSKFNENIDRIYLTQYDESKQVRIKNRAQFRMSHAKLNRPLELDYYKLAAHLKNAIQIPTSDVEEARKFIVEDLENSGYLSD